MVGYWREFKSTIKRGWFYFIGSIIVFGIGGVVAFIGNASVNPFIMLFGFIFMAGAVFLFRKGIKAGSVRIIGEGKDAEEVEKVALLIRERSIAFEDVKEATLVGFPQKSLNDNLFYYLQFIGMDGGTGMSEFSLVDDEVDKRYFPPSEMANVVTMTAYKKAINYISAPFQKVPAFVIGAIIALEVIGLIATV